MKIHIDNRTTIDTARDLGPEERHVLQKLFAWKTLVLSLDQFREKKAAALKTGWNNSGPIRETRALSLVCRHMEKEIRERLKTEGPEEKT